jgi:SAM-dependent methyltransferase
MKHHAFGHRLPLFISAPLFGDRDKYGYQPIEDDPSWVEYKSVLHKFYNETQMDGVGQFVNDAGYQVLQNIPLDEQKVLEIGPGDLRHLPYWQGLPDKYVIVDLYEEFLQTASEKLSEKNIPFEKRLTSRAEKGSLPSKDNEFDLIVTFYSLEHLYPFKDHLMEMLRVLKPGGRIVGAIPAEGGFAWGLGRYLTSRRWFKSNTNVDPDKIISWEHPTMSDEIISTMHDNMDQEALSFWPLRAPMIDVNLIIKFIYRKPE